MATFEEALMLASEGADSESRCLVINSDLRTISAPPSLILGVYNDKEVLKIPFKMPRYYEEIDLSEFSIQINYINAAGMKNFSEADDIEIGTDEITFNWTTERAVFVTNGTVRFTVCLRLSNIDGDVLKEFNTTIGYGIVLEGIEPDPDPSDVEAYSIIAHMIQIKNYVDGNYNTIDNKVSSAISYIDSTSESAVNRINSAVEAAENIIEEAEESMSEIRALTGYPTQASTAAGMTDHSKIYVYTGSETGYSKGHWYCYDGSAWVDGGLFMSQGTDTDKTLKVSNVPADSKAVGDMMKNTSEEVSDYHMGLFVDDDSDLSQADGDLAKDESLTALIGTEIFSIRKTQNLFTSYSEIKKIVQNGLGPKVFAIGEQIPVTWNNGTTDYEAPFDIVHFGPVKRRYDKKIVPGMILLSHYSFPGVQFDGNETFYVAESTALPAGTYNITMGNSWGSNVVANKSYYFITTAELPVGGQLVFEQEADTTGALPDRSPSLWRVVGYSSPESTTPLFKVSVTEGTNGTNLGTLSSSTKYDADVINNMQRSAYGYNRWSQCGARQIMNSSKPIGEWWKPQNKYDRPPKELATMRGFQAGFPDEFLNAIEEVEITTALNTSTDSTIGTSETTYDKFFLPSLEELYVEPQIADIEGEPWDYYKKKLRIDAPWPKYTSANHYEHEELKIPTLENHNSYQTTRLRSASRGSAYNTWYVSSTGYVNSDHLATTSLRLFSACVIC